MYESYDKLRIINILVLRDIIKSTILYLGARSKVSLLSGAVPRIFDGCLSYFSSPQPPSREPP